ncbi:VIT domain-containing protein [Aquisphaera insulae]|uniref:VIT domain-containing protein n=1 Tax=Aquisphaera insulae TaxID=2712864 RepID=UPI0020304D51|nr:VIT domain-containing protein [Aquisphaera insulae]
MLVILAWAPSALAQGFIVDRRPTIPIARSFEIREVLIDARVKDQVAEVQVSQTFHNPGSVQIESEFLFPLPEEGAVQNFVLLVDGKELPGRLMNKDEARRIYEEIVRTKRDPALLEYMGRGLYRTSVFPIPPGADRKVTMRYTQLCKRDRDLVEFSYPLSTQKFTTTPIQRLGIQISLTSKGAIKSIYSPSDDARIDRSGDHEARVSLERRDIIPSADFRLVYSLAEGAVGASVLSYRPSSGEDGYFLLLASPEVRAAESRPLPKTAIFVLDRSGSMAGRKIEQARKALRSVLNNLREDDLFNIVVYDDRVESFRPELERFTSRTREEAERYVDNIREGGSTNIDSALKAALGMIRDDSRPSYVLFLTDGLPTTGETQELKIAENCRQANARRAKIFCFGVGYDVNARLLDRLSGSNSGTSEYVKPDEDIEAHVGRFYAKLTSPVLTDTRIELAGTDVNRTYPRDIPDLFDGGQIVWVGRYRQSGPTTVKISGKVGGDRRSFESSAELADSGRGSGHDFVERIWAMRRVGYLIDQIDLSGQNRELIDELVALSTKYGIMTPYTSFLADERVPLTASVQNFERARDSFRALDSVSGSSGVAQRGLKQEYMKADRGQVQEQVATRFGNGEGLGRSMGMGGYGGAPAASAPHSGMMSMGGGGRLSGPAMVSAMGRREGRMAEAGNQPTTRDGQTVRQVGAKTFYFKENRWIDSTVKPDDDAKARRVRQFSDEFFTLARSQKPEFNQYLTFREPVTVSLDGTVYRIDPEDGRP